MTDDQFKQLVDVLSAGFGKLNSTLAMLAEAAVQIEHNQAMQIAIANPAPAYQKPLSAFESFNWASINAIVTETDDDGVSAVEWQGKIYKRRAGNPLYDDKVAYFSRSIGLDPVTKEKRYERLITFKDTGPARELSRGTARALAEVKDKNQFRAAQTGNANGSTAKAEKAAGGAAIATKAPPTLDDRLRTGLVYFGIESPTAEADFIMRSLNLLNPALLTELSDDEKGKLLVILRERREDQQARKAA